MPADGIIKTGKRSILCSVLRKAFFFSILILFSLLLSTPQNIYCQDSGFKYIRNFSPKEYGCNPQNWAVIQDKRGIIYIANQGGLLEFDGVTWRKIEVTNTSVHSLAVDHTGTIYIGGNNEIGFLAPDLKGNLQYKSLLGYLEDNQKEFSYVWRTYLTDDGVCFQTSKFLFRWNNGHIKVLNANPADNTFKLSFCCMGKLLVRQGKIGIKKMAGDQLELVRGGEIFADKKVYMMASYDTQKLLIGTQDNGFYLYDGSEALPFPTEADDYVKKNRLSHGVRLLSGDFALATRLGGLVIFDSQGRLKYIFNEASGLQDNNVKYVFEDTQGNLWLGLDNGIARIEYTSPISIYDKRSGLVGLVLSVARHGPGSTLYAGTTSGLYYFTSPAAPGSSGKFRPVPGISSACWSLLSCENHLMAATDSGVFQVGIKNNVNQVVFKKGYCFILNRSKMEANRIWVGSALGLFSLYREVECWAEERKFKNINQEIRSIVEDKRGNLWLGTLTKGVLKVDFPAEGVITGCNVTSYDTSQGLPEGEIHVFWAAGHVLFASEEGIYRFDELKKAFVPDFTLGEKFAGSPNGKDVYRIVEDRNKNIWFHSELRNIQAIPNKDGTLKLCKKPFLRIPLAEVDTIYPDPDGQTIWFGGDEGLIRFDKRIKKNYDLDFLTLIRKVVVNEKLVFNGYKSNYKVDNETEPDYLFPIIDYKDRNPRFEFSTPFFEDESKTEYQCLLEGYNNDWLPWTLESHKEYTNLDSGTYRFRVRAKNIYENLSREAYFDFKVLPPWTKTWWALLFYILMLFLVVFLIVRWRSGRLERDKRRLEKIVKERTREINEKSQQLEKQTLQLQEQSEKLKEMDKVKSHFFANISHEFRTPLTLIMGPLEQMLLTSQDTEQKKSLNVMLGNSQRLLTLINQLLDLSRFDSGKMKLQASCQNIIPFLKGILASFESLAVQNKIGLIFSADSEHIMLYFDPEKLEEVTINLLSNAVKFTPPGGKIFLAVKTGPTKEDKSQPISGYLEISVRDTGIGIPKEQLEHIFDRFYQAGGSTGHSPEFHHKGTGIGLALAKESVELHHGKIDVHSREGKGTEFTIRLPLGKAHLKPDEIVETPGVPLQRKKPIDISSLYIEEEEGEEKITDEEEKDIEPGKEEQNVILVVEDNAEVRQYIRGPLQSLYQVKEAVNGRKGIDLAKKIIPDLIISDIMMPELDGYELCRVLKQDIKTSHIPIILLTARASEESIIQGLETGADDYITKPFNTRILLTRVRNLIDLRRQLQQKIQRELVLQPAEIAVSSIDQEFIKELQETIEKNLADTLFGVEQLGKKLYMSRASLYRKVYALTGESPREFIKSYRLKRGAQLLKANFGNVTEVAFEVGFSSTSYFIKCFKEKFQQSPHTFQAAESSGKPPDSE